MSKIDIIARFKIHQGKSDEFKSWAEKCLETVRSKEPETLKYDWYFNDELNECIVIETYANSGAVMQHFANMGDLLGEAMAFSEVEGEVLGSPSAQVVEALAPLGVTHYKDIQGL